MKELHLFPNGQVERGNGKPGYDWHPAYSEVTPTGESQPLTLSDWRAMARRDGQLVKIHKTKQDARAAIGGAI